MEGMDMRKWVSVLSLILSAIQTLLGQPAPAVVPLPDYEVYATLINQLAFNRLERLPILSNRTARPIFIDEYTTALSSPGFNVDFNDLRSRSFPHSKIDSLLKHTEWTTFIASADQAQFSRCRLEKIPSLPSYEARLWTAAFEERYFGKKATRPGFFGLRADYPEFAGIISLSRVAYSPDGQKAICYFSKVTDGEAGEGSLVFVERIAGRWKVVGLLTLWIS
ncbi:hypothetical protein ACAW74_18705 [Fibrella sp. WM1]|uniref:hypothetical protein n=1 Tax=Fibrella musci TaxID=3242485 RepID=UPI0035206477